MIYAQITKPLIRLLALGLVGAAALLTSGCANGPGDTTGGTTGGGTTGGCTTDCVPIPVECPVTGQTFTAFKIADAKVTTVKSSGICIGCTIDDAIDVIDDVTTNYAIMSISVGALIAGNSITVTDTKTTFPAGAVAGFIVSTPDAPILALDLLQSIKVSTINAGTDTGDSASGNNLLVLDLLGLINNETLHFVSAGTTTKPFNAARLNLGGVVSALTQLHVYGAGICQ